MLLEFVILLVKVFTDQCVYDYRPSYFSKYVNTLGEPEGFVNTQQCDVNILVGDLNIDFD